MRNGRTAVLCLLAASLGLAAPAGADWLVTRDGGKVETRGPWKLQGKRVIFTLTDGTLSSLRLAEVDLDASRQVTTAAQQAQVKAAQPAPAPRKSVRVLTDKDFPRPEPSLTPEGGAEGQVPAGTEKTVAAAAPSSTSAIQVTNWKQNRNEAQNQIEVSGMVQNTGPDLTTAVAVVVRLYDAGGEVLASQQASLATRTLKAGQNTAFQAVFPGVITFSSAKFEPSSIPMLTRETAPAPQDTESTEGENEEPPTR